MGLRQLMRACPSVHTLRASLLPRRHPTCARVSRVMASSVLQELRVYCATIRELDTAKSSLQQAKLIASRGHAGEESRYCALHFVGTADAGTSSGAHQGHQRSSSSAGAFDVPRYLSSLQTAVLGRLVLAAEAITSTQSIIQDNVAALPDGTLCVADRQVGGKALSESVQTASYRGMASSLAAGRGGNRWESPEGCLMFSVCKRLELSGPRLPFVQYLVSLAVVQAVQEQAQQRLQGGGINVRIKWPNDIYSGALKIGGVLCHSSYRDGMFYVIMGVGLNVSNRQPTTCIDALIEEEAAARGLPTPAPVPREALLAGLISRLEPMLALLCQQGFEPLQGDYYHAWLHSNQEVLLEERDQRVPVTIKGLSQQGYLEAEDTRGERYELHPDGNSFDFFKGLVRKKIGCP